MYVPYSSLESVIEHNKEGYYLALRRTQGTLEDDHPRWEPWLRFFLASLKAQKDRLKSKVDIRQGWENLPKEAVMILDYVQEKGRITTREAEALTHMARSTLKKRINKLVEDGLLVQCGQGRGTWYRLV